MSVRFKQFLVNKLDEAPIPDDWDKGVFSDSGSFRGMLRHAIERSTKIGTGSSRVAFQIPFEGRETILKIAKNKKGLAQNEAEVDALANDWYLKKLNITIPIIDYDETSERPRWIHMEKASKVSPSEFRRITGGSPDDLIAYALYASGRIAKGYYGDKNKINPDADVVSSFVDYVGSYTHHPVGDYTRLANWGLYKGNLVIIDIGLTDDVYSSHYRR